MAFCSGMMSAVTAELDTVLKNARIDRIMQPERDTVYIVFRTQGGQEKLIINASSDSPRISLTEELPENPAVPPMFTMLLRKYIGGARVDSVTQTGFERIAVIALTGHDEFNEVKNMRLVCEIMGKNSNIILTDGNGVIIGALRTADFAESVRRRIMPGIAYRLPPAQDKNDPTAVTKSEFVALARATEKQPDRFLVDTFFGISPLTAREIAHRSLSGERLTEQGISLLCDNFFAVMDGIKKGVFPSCILRDGDSTPVEVSFFPITQYGDRYFCDICKGPSAALDAFYRDRDRARRKKEKTQAMTRSVNTVIAKLEKKTALQKGELKECEHADELRRFGEIIMSNLYAMTGKSASAELTDYYSEGCPTVKIPLDPKLGARQNAEKYFKKYTKLKRADVILREQIRATEEEIAYLRTVLASISLCDTEQELSEIRSELVSASVLREKNGKNAPKKKKAYQLTTVTTASGRRITIGKNNLQNDYITNTLAQKSDWWFHVKNAPGSHVVMECAPGEEPSVEDFNEAIALAAKYSSISGSGDIPVDYTRIKNIKKPPSSRPGYVTYSTNYTAYYKSIDG